MKDLFNFITLSDILALFLLLFGFLETHLSAVSLLAALLVFSIKIVSSLFELKKTKKELEWQEKRTESCDTCKRRIVKE